MPWQPELPFSDSKPLADNEASRTIALGDRIVPYILRRSRRRSIGLQIDHRGLRVGAPYRATLTEVETLIYKHGDWIAQKLDEWREQRRPEMVVIHDGLRLPLLGRSLEIRLTSGNNRFEWNDTAEPMLTLRLRHADAAGEVLERALRERALAWFSARLKDFSNRLGLTPPPHPPRAAYVVSEIRCTNYGYTNKKISATINDVVQNLFSAFGLESRSKRPGESP